jgi:hypothetical protein
VEGKPLKIKDGVFIEVKRLVRESLGGKTVEDGVKPDKSVAVVRKLEVLDALKKAAPAAPAAAPAAEAAPTDAAAAPADAGAKAPPKRTPPKTAK